MTLKGKLCQIQILDQDNTINSGLEELSDLFFDELSKISNEASKLKTNHHGLARNFKDMLFELTTKIAKKIGRELGKGYHYLVDDDFVNNILDKLIKIKTIREDSYKREFTSVISFNGLFEIGIKSINTEYETVDIQIFWDDEEGYKEKLQKALQSLTNEVIEKLKS